MNDLSLSTNSSGFEGRVALTMSTIEIADLIEKRHDNVLRDARKMLLELSEEGLLRFEDTYVNLQNGQEYPCLKLPKRECFILMSGYDVGMRAKIVDRWMELEGASPGRPDVNYLDPKHILGFVQALQAQKRTLSSPSKGPRSKLMIASPSLSVPIATSGVRASLVSASSAATSR